MRPAPSQPLARRAALAACVALAGCAQGGDPGRLSTKSGEILILEPDGQVTTMQLDSPGGRDAFAAVEADLASLSFGGAVVGGPNGGPNGGANGGAATAQDRALRAFAARTRPALPDARAGVAAQPGDFIGARVAPVGDRGNLVEVVANLRQGVDADIAFSYATCALAGWAKTHDAPYARHIRTLQDTRDGKQLVQGAFLLSQTQPLGLRVMETNDTLRECKARGIPAA